MSTSKDTRTALMASPNVAAAMWRLAGPAIISMVVLAIYNMADTYFVGLVSDNDLEVAAISVYMPILLVTQAISVLFASGGGAYLSRQLGEKDLQGANLTASTTAVLAFLSGVIVLVTCIPAADPLLYTVGASAETIDLARDYAMIMFAAAPIQLTNMALNNLLRAEGNAVRSMSGLVTGAVLNMVLDPVFILGFGQSVFGAAVATAISQVVSFLILASAYWHGKTTACIRLRGFRFRRGTVGEIIRIGMSTFLIQIFTGLGIAVMNVCAKPYGDGAIAAIGIANRLQYLGFAILFGFSQGYQPVCGYNYGAKRFVLVRSTMFWGIATAIVLGGGIAGMFRVFGRWFVQLFADEAEVIATSVDVLNWFTIALPLTAFSLIMMMTYQSLGRVVGATVLACVRQGVCMIPLLLTLTQIWGFRGILLSPLFSDLVSAVIALVLALRVFRFIKPVVTGK